MDLELKLGELGKRVRDHREVLLTEEAAKNALVMPFLQALGYDVFNPAEVVPEYTCDVGTKKGEKVDYAICDGGRVRMLVECKPASVELSVANASQLFRYFSVTEARLAVLTNGVTYKFFSDIDAANRMDEKPFFTCQIDSLRKQDVATLERFTRASFDIEQIVKEAGALKLQSLVYKELERELANPSEDFVRLVAAKVHSGHITAAVRETYRAAIVSASGALVRNLVNARLTSALSVSNPPEPTAEAAPTEAEIETTEEEIAGFNIVRAIAAKRVDPRRIVTRDQKSYCAILLDDNNRKSVARLHFNSATARYLGMFTGKDETRHPVTDPIDIYKHADAILARIDELEGEKMSQAA